MDRQETEESPPAYPDIVLTISHLDQLLPPYTCPQYHQSPSPPPAYSPPTETHVAEPSPQQRDQQHPQQEVTVLYHM